LELKFILEKLKGQKSDLKFANLDIWLPTTYQYIEDHFRSYSSRATTFYNLIQEYNMKKASSNTILVGPFAFDYIKNKAEGFLSEIISVLEHEYEQQQTAAKITADNIKKQQEHLAKLTATQKQQTPSPTKHENLILPPEPKVIIKTQLPFGIKAEFFWGIMVVIIGFSYWLGTKWENFELRDEVKTLKSDTTSKGGKITQYESAAETKNKMIGSIRDSLNKSKKSLDSIIKGSKTSN
jgi:hypothetical protein